MKGGLLWQIGLHEKSTKSSREIHEIIARLEREAVLVSAVATFHTNDDDKDWDTRLSIFIRRRDSSEVAFIRNIMGRFPDHTNNGPFGLSIKVNIPKTEVATCHTDLEIVPVGNDTWRFNYYLDLGFSDGSHLNYSWPGRVLDQDARVATFVL